VRLGTIVSAALAAISLVLFAVNGTYLGEGYDGPLDAVVLIVAWLAIFIALGVALVTAFGNVPRLRRRL